MTNKMKFAVLASAKFVLAGWMVAQGTPQTTAMAAPNPAAKSAPDATEQHTAPVFWISSVEVLRSTHAPQLDVIRVRGLASNHGWESAELVPLTRSLPPDGVLDLALVAEAPADNTEASTFPEMEAVFVMEPGHPFRGVRVHGAANRVALHALPGYAVAPPPPKDCADCIGKTFIGRSQNAAATNAADSIREEELPRNLRVIRESDGLGSLDSNPNRMTILLNENSQIVMAMWD